MSKLISVGELIDQSWEHYRTSWQNYIGISAWIVVVIALDVLALLFYPNAQALLNTKNLTGGEVFGLSLYSFTNYLLAPLLGFWIFVALVRSITGKLAASKAMREAKRFFLPSFFSALLVLCLMLLAALVSFSPVILLTLVGWLTKSDAITVAAMALIGVCTVIALVLTLRWTIHYYFAPYVPLLERARGVETLRRSRMLVNGHFWAVLWRLLVTKLVFVLLGVIALTVFFYVADVFVASVAGLNLDVYSRLNSIVVIVLPVAIAALLNPALVIADTLLYRSLQNT